MKNNKLNRRKFFAMLGLGSLALAAKSLTSRLFGRTFSAQPPLVSLQTQTQAKPVTNIADALKIPRGLFKSGSNPGAHWTETNWPGVNCRAISGALKTICQ